MKKGICFLIIIFLLLPKFVVFSGNGNLDIRVVLQNPSYVLEKQEEKQYYICDATQSECKVNYNLEINEWSWYKSIGTKYFCQWDFWISELTWEEDKCNPNTVIYPLWTFTTSFKVILKTDESIFFHKELFIQNGEIVDNSENDVSENWEEELFDELENSWDEIEEEILEDIYDEEENENLSNDSIESESEDKYEIEEENFEEQLIDQPNNDWSQQQTEEENQVDIWSDGEMIENILETDLDIINNEPDSSNGSTHNNPSEEQNNFLLFPFPIQLTFQSPTYLLEKDIANINTFNCDISQTECRVNFNLNINEGLGWKSIWTKYWCQWDFWIWEITGEEQKCNPNTIVYPIWNFQSIYKIYEKSNTWVFYEQTVSIKNTWYQEPIITKTVYIWWGSSSSTTPLFIEVPKIEIQSWLDENNVCKKEDCSINLNYIQKSSSEVCLWSFPGWIYEWNTHEKCNPWYVKYPIWDFKVTLKVYDKNYPENYKESYFSFSNKKIEILKNNQDDNTIFSEEKNDNIQNNESEAKNKMLSQKYTLKITQVLPNPVGVNNLEFIEIQNTWTETLNIYGCSLDDIMGSGSKPYYISQDIILEPNQTKKFYKYDTKININNSWNEEVNILCNGNIIDSMKWNFSVSEGFILKPEQNISEIILLKKQKNKLSYEITYASWENKIITFEEKNTILDDLMSEDISREEKKQKFFDILEKSFSQKISKQKSWIKIIWTTFPYATLVFQFEKQENEVGFFRNFFPKTYANNLTYETKSDKDWNYEFIITEPEIWEFELKTFLSFWDKNVYQIPKTLLLEVDNDYLQYIQTKQTKTQEVNYIVPKAIITLQWALSQNKTFINNRLICSWVNECSVNFDGSKSEWKNLEYFWDFWNGKTFEKKNPASYKFWVWSYSISLTVNDELESHTAYFVVEVIGKPEKETKTSQKVENKIDKNNKIDIIPTAYADNKKSQEIKYHIFLSLWVLIVFFIGGIILLRRQKII